MALHLQLNATSACYDHRNLRRREVLDLTANPGVDGGEYAESLTLHGTDKPSGRRNAPARVRRLLGGARRLRGAHLVVPDGPKLGVVAVLADPELALGAGAHLVLLGDTVCVYLTSK